MKSESEFCLNRIYPPVFFLTVHTSEGKGKHTRNTLFFPVGGPDFLLVCNFCSKVFLLKHKHTRFEPPKFCTVLNTLGETVSVTFLKSICTPESCKVFTQGSVHAFSQFWPLQGLFGQTHHLSSLNSNLATCL